ncbi:hypothetical protein L3Q82_006431 [Scortum barcoo]|uniref:Uncharacterized protein n=1 Tax=Scortum barcoo TaxID=214431 RepID=A0ACB8WZE1_9TELE|nr:hypothetical protein L3Q82_006431 [Scortum barcoo]
MFSMASPDSVTSVTCAQCEPAFICEEHRAPVANLPILVFSGKCQTSCTVLGCKHNPHLWTSGPHTTLMESVSDRLSRHMHICGLLEPPTVDKEMRLPQRAIMCVWCLETQVPLHEQGACCEQRPAALKRRSPVQPDSQLRSALPCQATPRPAGGNLQLQHLSHINSSAPTLKASGCAAGFQLFLERCTILSLDQLMKYFEISSLKFASVGVFKQEFPKRLFYSCRMGANAECSSLEIQVLVFEMFEFGNNGCGASFKCDPKRRK